MGGKIDERRRDKQRKQRKSLDLGVGQRKEWVTATPTGVTLVPADSQITFPNENVSGGWQKCCWSEATSSKKLLEIDFESGQPGWGFGVVRCHTCCPSEFICQRTHVW